MKDHIMRVALGDMRGFMTDFLIVRLDGQFTPTGLSFNYPNVSDVQTIRAMANLLDATADSMRVRAREIAEMEASHGDERE